MKLHIKEELDYSEYQKHFDDIIDVDGICTAWIHMKKLPKPI